MHKTRITAFAAVATMVGCATFGAAAAAPPAYASTPTTFTADADMYERPSRTALITNQGRAGEDANAHCKAPGDGAPWLTFIWVSKPGDLHPGFVENVYLDIDPRHLADC